MTQHSPGPWEIDREYSNCQDEILDADGRTIAVVWTRSAIPGATARPQFKDVPALKENARLIAAAPDLLAALQAIMQTGFILNAKPCTCKAGHSLPNDCAICRAREAIATATTG